MGRLIIILLLLSSCTALKNKQDSKIKKETNRTTTERITRFQEADTTIIQVPNIVYKDTTIIKRGRTSTAYVNFNSSGQIDFQCINDKIQETIERTIKEQTKEKNKEEVKDKKTEYNPFKIGGGAGLFFGIIIIIYFLARKFI